MQNVESVDIKLELKYCERCGTLGLRPQGSDLLFCAACVRAMAGLARSSHMPPQGRNHSRYPITNSNSSTFWSEGGKA